MNGGWDEALPVSGFLFSSSQEDSHNKYNQGKVRWTKEGFDSPRIFNANKGRIKMIIELDIDLEFLKLKGISIEDMVATRLSLQKSKRYQSIIKQGALYERKLSSIRKRAKRIRRRRFLRI